MIDHMDPDFRRWNDVYEYSAGVILDDAVDEIRDWLDFPDRTARRIEIYRVLLNMTDELANCRKVAA